MRARVQRLCATTTSPNSSRSMVSKLRGGEATVCTTGTRRARDSTRPTAQVLGFGANTKCHTSERDRASSHSAARALSASEGAKRPASGYTGSARTRPPSEGAPTADMTTGSTRDRCSATSRTRHLVPS